MSLLDKAAVAPRALSHRELVELVTWPDAEELFSAAYAVKCREIGLSYSRSRLYQTFHCPLLRNQEGQREGSPLPHGSGRDCSRGGIGV